MSYRLQFIDNIRFMDSLLSNLVNSMDIMKKNVKLTELNTKIATAFFNTQT